MNEFNDKDNELAREKAKLLDDFFHELATIVVKDDLDSYSAKVLEKVFSLGLRYNNYLMQNLKESTK